MIRITVLNRQIKRSEPGTGVISLFLRDAAVRLCIILIVALATGLRALPRTKPAVRQVQSQVHRHVPSE
ncbi:hypothetical protein ABH15_13380 [Methanoculleus taiwanensis]|uniref:Uncharacterized protein n=1 Tax=Methanoculleus taiwanensis TaxID=1550565 RepID=A0A498H009_9EURY|nr:hypothetical protein ABH15_13380 [Methanoculleus taiwanensis]